MKKLKNVVVKVQQSLVTSESQTMMLIYAQGHKPLWSKALTDEVKARLGARPKVYFYADFEPDSGEDCGYSFKLLDEAPAQEW